MMAERLVETTMTILRSGDVEVPMKSDSGIEFGILTIPSKSDYIEQWVANYKVELKDLVSRDENGDVWNITMVVKSRR
jgi:hypothetical protein